MPPRASWTGHIKCSLVSFPVRIYNAITASSRISFNQLSRKTNNRLRQQMVDPEEGEPVDRADIVKGYEYEKDHYVIIDDSDLEKIRLETARVIDLQQFVHAEELDPLYLENPYYVAPDGPVAEEAFRVFREAMKAKKQVGIGRLVLSGREQIVAMGVKDKGFVLTTLRYAAEVRSSTAYFEDIRNGEVSKPNLKLAEQLIASLTRPFDPAKFTDRYQDALMEVIKAKIEGTEPVVAQEVEMGTVINLMEALKQSVAAAPKKPPAKSIKKTPKKATKKKTG